MVHLVLQGKNYVFDRRFAHGAKENVEVVSKCSACDAPWDRYQAQAKCSICTMETLLCRDCQRSGVQKDRARRLLCWVCAENKSAKGEKAAAAAAAARAFAASGGGRDGEGEGRAAAEYEEEGDDDRGGAGGRGGGGAGRGGRGGFRR